MRQFSQAEIINKLARYRPENDGSVTSDCLVCELEKSGKGKDKLKVFSEGNVVCLRFKGLGDAGEHLKAIHEALGLDVPIKVSAFIEEHIFDGQLTIQVNPAERNRQRVIARNRTEVLHIDELNLHDAKKRDDFVKSLAGFSDFEQAKILSMLVQMVDRFDRALGATQQEQEVGVEYTGFKVFEDGSILEQMRSGFALYRPAKQTVILLKELSLDNVTYRPLADGGAINFADNLIEYESDEKLDRDIESYVYKHIDLSPRDQKIAARYIKFSYIADKVKELSYLRPIGPSGSGKSRYIRVAGGACYRSFIAISPSAASVFRLVDKFRCTLCVDEANWIDSVDTADIIRLLNAGFQRGNMVPRIEPGPKGELITRNYDPFGPKLIASLKTTESNAFESRCIRAEMYVTKRKDIRFRLTQKLLDDQAELRGKLTLWRLRNFHRDFETEMDSSEDELRKHQIKPRYIQIGSPLFMLLGDDQLKTEFVEMFEGRTSQDADDQREELDGQLAEAIHGLFFEAADPDIDPPVMKLRTPPDISRRNQESHANWSPSKRSPKQSTRI
jgi:hypothetical protein